ncbi:Ankyrin repeat and death domain-containing protein 1A [Fusarium oxysporum f. sp. albedinis]|nr:Ankyrin repeat and death domain-containing protein 1A [Fusarium oxysporum f. sp. albedinis]
MNGRLLAAYNTLYDSCNTQSRHVDSLNVEDSRSAIRPPSSGPKFIHYKARMSSGSGCIVSPHIAKPQKVAQLLILKPPLISCSPFAPNL